MKTHGNGNTDEQIRDKRIAFIDHSRSMALSHIQGLIDTMDTGEFVMKAFFPSKSPEPFYCVVTVTHEDGPQAYRTSAPISLAYPDSVFPAILADILYSAKSDCQVNMN